MRRALLAAAIAALLVPATASASTLSVSGGAAQYTAAPAEANHLTISFVQGYYVFSDTGVGSIVVIGSTCHSYSPQSAYCPFGWVGSITARLGNGGSYAQSQLSFTPVTLDAGNGGDTLFGGGGADTLVTGAGHDKITCGAGADRVQADPSDTVATDCEQVAGGAAPAASTAGPDSSTTPSAEIAPVPPAALPPAAPAPVAQVLSTPVTVTPSSTLPLKVACPAGTAGGCQGSVTIALNLGGAAKGKATTARRRKVVLRAKAFSIPAGKTGTVSVPLDRRSVRIFRSRGRTRRFKATVTVSMRTEAGTLTSTRNVQVRAARRRPTPKRARRKVTPAPHRTPAAPRGPRNHH